MGIRHWDCVCTWERFPEGGCWQAVSDMKTRPAGIGNVNADWMGSLPSKLSAMPLKTLAVPGEPVVRKDVWPPLSVRPVFISLLILKGQQQN